MVLYEFYGDGCPHCENMEEDVQKVQDENQGVNIERLEVWNDKENAKKKEDIDDGVCGGVPFFYNTDTDQWICGETGYKNLEKWATGEKV
jgi:hypothetical protein